MLSDKYDGNLHQINSMELLYQNMSIEYKNNKKIIKMNTEIDRFAWIIEYLMAKIVKFSSRAVDVEYQLKHQIHGLGWSLKITRT